MEPRESNSETFQTLNLRNHWVKEAEWAALSLIINNKDVVRLECALTGIPVCWCQSFKDGHTEACSAIRAWWTGFNTNICSSEHNKYRLCSIWEAWHTENHPLTHKTIILSVIQLYFKFFESHRGAGGNLVFSRKSPSLFPYNVI